MNSATSPCGRSASASIVSSSVVPAFLASFPVPSRLFLAVHLL
jgi:hypothetical protein